MASELVPMGQRCSCAEIAGENPHCIQHGEGTMWRKENPDICELAERIAELEAAVIAFGAPWAVQYAREFGFPEGHLHPAHYDILAHAGARLDSFVRGDPALLGDREG